MTREIIDGIVRLTADEDKWLTNGITNSKQVYIGRLCSEDDWREVNSPIIENTESDAEEILSIILGGDET